MGEVSMRRTRAKKNTKRNLRYQRQERGYRCLLK